jgi:hypothetical protein
MLIIADLHCGHEFGLTPPDWWVRDDTGNVRVTKAGRFQRHLWKFYTEAVDALRPIDILVVNGDAIDGKGERSGGMELLTTDRNEQVDMAKFAIDYVKADKIRVIYGTRYHVGKEEDFEAVLGRTIKGHDVEVQGHAFIDVNGCNVDIKHKVASSTIPHGRMTAIARSRLWNLVWYSEHERQPKANILIRSHVHYFTFAGGKSWLGIVTPALCYNSAYGIRECEGLVDVGMVYFDFDEEGKYEWAPVFAEFESLRVKPESL